LIEKLNDLPGVQLDLVSHASFAASEATAAEARRQAREAELLKMEQDAAAKAAEREKKVQDMLDNRAADRAREETEKEAEKAAIEATAAEKAAIEEDKLRQDNWANSQPDSIDKVNEGGSINDTVDISSEDLQTLRELAEMKNIQNFVSVTPT